ncbi:MFS transporter [Nocardiopsis kunsanensis]|uniref:MFS transporter n=1 Tax=Nocardiopsis kunsanensis TaxID=141693 RepID=UPI00034C10BA|nr:MFS transporter [Nocardiopsis kunsanensis]
MDTPHRERTGPRSRLGALLLLLPALLVSMDISVLFVAAPVVVEDLDPTATQWLWMMDVYGFVLAGLLIPMGALGDRIGRRRLLLAGALAFGAASALLAAVPTPQLFIAGRVLLGAGAATLAPSTLSLLRVMFTDPGRRRTAVGMWTAAFAGGAVVGPVIGGALLEFFWWGSVFLINLPVMALLLAAGPFLLPEYRSAGRDAFDLTGAVASLVAVIALVQAAKRFVEHGPDGAGAVALAVGAAALTLFLLRQRRARNPLVDLSLFTRPAFSASVLGNTAVSFAASGLGLLTFTFLQVVHGASPLSAALYTLPTVFGTVTGATLAGILAARIRPAVLMPGGLSVGAAGFGSVAAVGTDTHIAVFIGGYTVLTLGIGLVATLANTLILATAPPERAGAAAGVSETSTELGGALGIATLGTVAASVYRDTMAGAVPGAGRAATENVAGASSTAAHLPPEEAASLLATAFDAYTSGMSAAAATGAGTLLLVALVAAASLRRIHAGTGREPAVAGPPPV